jgi:hypothetical protein
VTPIGRVFDIFLEKNKMKRPAEGDAASVSHLSEWDVNNQALSLVALSALPDRPRQADTLLLSGPCSSIGEGSTVVLVKD